MDTDRSRFPYIHCLARLGRIRRLFDDDRALIRHKLECADGLASGSHAKAPSPNDGAVFLIQPPAHFCAVQLECTSDNAALGVSSHGALKKMP